MPANKKPAALRRRANRSATAATLHAIDPDEVDIPDLPDRRDTDGQPTAWCAETITWWRDVWMSPMAGEYLAADLHGLIRLAVLVDNYWRQPSATAHAEIRLAQKDFGLTPYDRRRLEWQVETTEDALARGRRRRGDEADQVAAAPAPMADPRLRLVSDWKPA